MASLATRRSTYYRLSTTLAHFDNDQLKTLLQNADTTRGWGVNHTLTIGKSRIFAKSVPVTDLEYTHQFATRNLFDLPTYYNYGVGSAGFGVWRELVTHIKTTNWVLSGACENFPLMYHHRLVPRMRENSAIDMDRHERIVTYWNSNANIGQYLLARGKAIYELVLFLEYIPNPLDDWLHDNFDHLNPFLGELWDTISFLRKNGIIHFDANFENIVTDGERPYLTDFGLTLDKRFDLSESERAFFKKNTYYDYGEILASLGWLLIEIFNNLSEAKKKKVMRKYGMTDDTPLIQIYAILSENIRAIYEDGVMKLNKTFVDTFLRYREPVFLMLKFFADMRKTPKKDTKFQHTKLKRLLTETGIQ